MDAARQKFPASGRLTASNLACRRGGRQVFEKLSFDIGAGEYLHLKGANGSGKTTLIRLLAGFLSANAGTLQYDGEELYAADIPDTGAFIYSGHLHGLKPVLTLRENSAAYYQLMTGRSLPVEVLERAADVFGLGSLIDHPVRFFSSGQTHRCSLLRFALVERPVWLMDEPTVGLDSENREKLRELMAQHLAAGGLIVAASHDPIDLPGATLEMATFAPSTKAEDLWL